MSKYKGLFTFDVDNHRYIPVGQADGIIDCTNYHPELEMPAEPLIKGRSQRAVLRAAARLSGMNVATVQRSDIAEIVIFDFGSQCRVELKDSGINVKNYGVCTIAELCGEEEAPEPLEPTFIDLDERIKEKEEE